LLRASRGHDALRPRDSVRLVAESAAVGRDWLSICARVTEAGGESKLYKLGTELPSRPHDAKYQYEGDRVTDRFILAYEGCELDSPPVPVLHVDVADEAELPAGVPAALYSAATDSSWSLGYLSAKPFFEKYHRLELDPSRSRIFVYRAGRKPYLLVLLPVTLVLDIPMGLYLAYVEVSCSAHPSACK
jgi:hypothetical protein